MYRWVRECRSDEGEVVLTEREQQLNALDDAQLDVLIIGAGINGAVSAAAAAASGAKVALIDRGDFASGVSSQSSNLAWGGIKYLESGEFRLVRKLCQSRNQLMDAFPSSVKEIRFFTSIWRGFRMPTVFVWLGAVLYWVMGGFRMAPPRLMAKRDIAKEEPLVEIRPVVGGLQYSDCYLVDNDARFVFGFVRKALDAGAIAANYVEMKSLRRVGRLWQAVLADVRTGGEFQVTTKTVVNAAGPAIDEINRSAGIVTSHHHLLSKGIHLIVDRLTSNRRVLTFFASDGRLFFVIPMGDKTCIGTTDTRVDAAAVGVTDEDREFVLRNVNARLNLKRPLSVEDVIAERVGVRPLAVAGEASQSDWLQLSRKHHLDVDEARAFVSIFGGKLTDCLNVGEEVVEVLSTLGLGLDSPGRWFGEPSAEKKQLFLARAERQALTGAQCKREEGALVERLWRLYGDRASEILHNMTLSPESAQPVLECADFSVAELQVIRDREMVVTLEDLFRRRSPLSLITPKEQILSDPGLHALATILFGDAADAAISEFAAAV